MDQKRRMLLYWGLDAILLSFSVFVSYLIRFGGEIPAAFGSGIPYAILITTGTTYLSFTFLKVYRCSWRQASVGEMLLIVKGTIVAHLMSFSLSYGYRLVDEQVVIPTSVLILIGMTSTASIGLSRFVWRLFHVQTLKLQPHHRKALIVGAGSAGGLVVKELLQAEEVDLYPVGFIDDDPKKLQLRILGIPVVGNRNSIGRAVKTFGVDTVIIAMPSVAREEVAKIINMCKETGVQTMLLPRVSDVIDGKVSISLIRDVHVEDLLGRESVDVDLDEISGYITGKTILVTGAGGSIGSELCRQISTFFPSVLLLLGHGENSIYAIENELRRSFPRVVFRPIIADIQDRNRIESIFDEYRPAIVFHAAAHKHVPLMEQNVAEAIKNNVLGTRNLAECAHIFGTERFVSISTDKAVNPTSVMGVTKRISEMMIQSLDPISSTKFAAVRFGNVLGSRGSVIPLFKEQIRKGGPVTVTHPDMVRYFMTIPEAVQLVIQAGALAQGGEVFILDMGKPMRISDLAHDLIRMSGLRPQVDIQVVYTGIRPGEKLFEEMLTSEEGATASKHNRIFIGKHSPYSYEELGFVLRKLEQAVQMKYTCSSEKELLSLMHRIVPTYQTSLEKPREMIKS
ncbi:polysaccharide biosynthesis protein [Brevibacillus sp. NRS-1366]|uniref:polysaccharide biosynthesis protein n=1 Tax=Brevibacillus sp. NRS-1366 TaxID=3233899 RepID=UPI003D21B58E